MSYVLVFGIMNGTHQPGRRRSKVKKWRWCSSEWASKRRSHRWRLLTGIEPSPSHLLAHAVINTDCAFRQTCS